jgi:ferrochelatase
MVIGGAFYEHPAFIRAFAEVAKPFLDEFRPDHVLLSYHGLPARHVQKSDITGEHCLKKNNCCDTINEANAYCYRAHCFATTRALTAALGLQAQQFSVSFQSRLGRDPWIKPYTDIILPELAQKGIKKLAVLCPAFVADCLETLEEVRIRAKEDFIKAGGEDLILVPSLNAHPAWVNAVVSLMQEANQRD